MQRAKHACIKNTVLGKYRIYCLRSNKTMRCESIEMIHMVQIQAAVASDSWRGGGGVTHSHTQTLAHPTGTHPHANSLSFLLLLHWRTPLAWRRFKSGHLIFGCRTWVRRITYLNLCNQLFFSHLRFLRHFNAILLQYSFAARINTFTD